MNKIILISVSFLTLFIVSLLAITYWQSPAPVHRPQAMLAEIKKSANPGEQIYNNYCANCHAQQPIIRLGAPRIGMLKDWQPRLQQSQAQLFQHTTNGIGNMPPRGGCFECDDQLLEAALKYMLPENKQG